MPTAWSQTASEPLHPETRLHRLERSVRGIAPILLLYLIYTFIRHEVADHGIDVGIENAKRILDIEALLRIDIERSLQQWSLPHMWLIRAANWYYVLGFLPFIITAAILAAWHAHDHFLHWRRVFAFSLMLALFGYAFYPLTPPRLLPAEYGFVDTMLLYGPHYYGDAAGKSLFNGYGRLPTAVNVHAAMPSMHVAWVLIASILMIGALPRRIWAILLIAVQPVLMSAAVIVTANHYVLDIVVGLLVLAAAMGLARIWAATWPPKRGATR